MGNHRPNYRKSEHLRQVHVPVLRHFSRQNAPDGPPEIGIGGSGSMSASSPMLRHSGSRLSATRVRYLDRRDGDFTLLLPTASSG